MADELIFYTNPMSRGQIVRWMLEEVGAPYETQILGYGTSMKDPAYLAINPLGKIPALKLDDGVSIFESDTILEYLEDVFPAHPLRPADPLLAARARLVARIGDLYVSTPMAGLFKQMMGGQPDPAIVAYELARMEQGLGHLDKVIGDKGFAVGEAFTTADCHLMPVVHFLTTIERAFKRDDLTADHPRVAAYRAWMKTHPLGAKIGAEIDEGLAAFQKG